MMITPAPVEFLHSAITLPEFNIFAIQFGDFGIRWYALAYIAGLLIGIYILRRAAQLPGALMTPDQTDRLLNYLLIGIIFGGRLGYVFFLQRQFLFDQPAINSPIMGGRYVLPWRPARCWVCAIFDGAAP